MPALLKAMSETETRERLSRYLGAAVDRAPVFRALLRAAALRLRAGSRSARRAIHDFGAPGRRPAVLDHELSAGIQDLFPRFLRIRPRAGQASSALSRPP